MNKNGKPILEVRDLRQFFPVQEGFLRRTIGYVKAVNGVSFTINEGETLGLVGESGCGKSTLGCTILRLYEPTGGEVILHDGDEKLSVFELSHREMRYVRANMQMIFQDPFASLNERMTVLENVIEPLVCNDIGTSQEREAKAEHLLMQVGLQKEHLRRYPHSFSGGQRQRIGIARALSIEPKFIVADEPVFALDVSVQAQILNLMQELQAEFGLSYLFISHDMAVIRYVSDRIAVMYVGKLVEYAEARRTAATPRPPLHRSLAFSRAATDPTGVAVTASSSKEPHPIPVICLPDAFSKRDVDMLKRNVERKSQSLEKFQTVILWHVIWLKNLIWWEFKASRRIAGQGGKLQVKSWCGVWAIQFSECVDSIKLRLIRRFYLRITTKSKGYYDRETVQI